MAVVLRRLAPAMFFLMSLAAGPTFAHADQGGTSAEAALNRIIEEVIHSAAHAAEREVLRSTGIDPLQRGYVYGRHYDPVPNHASDELRRELHKLNDEHDREIWKLRETLDRELDQAEAEFAREASKEDKAEKIYEKRGKLREKVDKAYAKFEEKMHKENERFDEKRWQIIENAQGG